MGGSRTPSALRGGQAELACRGARSRADPSRPPHRQAGLGRSRRATRRRDRPSGPSSLFDRKGSADAAFPRGAGRGRDGARAVRSRSQNHQRAARRPQRHQGQSQERIAFWSLKDVTQPKSAAALDSAQEDAGVASHPIPFAPARAHSTSPPPAPQTGASPPAQPVQFAPGKTPSSRPAAAPQPAPAPPIAPAIVVKRKRAGPTRFLLLVVVPLIALAGGFAWWLDGGRFVTTDHADLG